MHVTYPFVRYIVCTWPLVTLSSGDSNRYTKVCITQYKGHHRPTYISALNILQYSTSTVLHIDKFLIYLIIEFVSFLHNKSLYYIFSNNLYFFYKEVWCIKICIIYITVLYWKLDILKAINTCWCKRLILLNIKPLTSNYKGTGLQIDRNLWSTLIIIY